MRFSCLTIFPDMIKDYLKYGLLGKALEKELLKVDVYDLRDFTANKHKKVDDRPFGGGPGMVMMPQPLFDAVKSIKAKHDGRVILFSAYGEVLTQKKIIKIAIENEHYILVCGRYEGVDQRFIDEMVDEEISIGQYVLMGGEVPALTLIEACSRIVPGVIGDFNSVATDSFFQEGQYACPQYTQPRCYQGLDVPEVILSGHHANIEAWRKSMEKNKKS